RASVPGSAGSRPPAVDRTTRARSRPVRTGGGSRAGCDRDQSSFSSDPGSAIEGFGQKIPLDDELADLGVKLRHLGLPADLRIRPLVVKRLGQPVDGLPLPLRDLIGVKLVLHRQFRNRPLAADRLKRDLGLEIGREPSACLHAGSSLSSENPPYAPVSKTGTTSKSSAVLASSAARSPGRLIFSWRDFSFLSMRFPKTV